MSLVQTSVAPALPRRPKVRRLVILSSGETDDFVALISKKRNIRIDVVRRIQLSNDACHENLGSLLSPEALQREGVSGILIANGDFPKLAPRLLPLFRLSGIEIFSESRFLEQEARCIDIDQHDIHERLPLKVFQEDRGEEIRKRIFDVLVASALLILAFPLMALVALLIKFDSAGPVMYRQERVGLKGRTFTLFKFRSMQQDAEADGSPQWAMIGDPRVTRIGRFIRYARIDELPQLLNVLRGEMSLIGPRPERPYFVQQLAAAIPLYSMRHSVKPGITGWAQVNASYGASIEDSLVKLRYDLYYIKYRRLSLDLKILLRTFWVVIFQEGAR